MISRSGYQPEPQTLVLFALILCGLAMVTCPVVEAACLVPPTSATGVFVDVPINTGPLRLSRWWRLRGSCLAAAATSSALQMS